MAWHDCIWCPSPAHQVTALLELVHSVSQTPVVEETMYHHWYIGILLIAYSTLYNCLWSTAKSTIVWFLRASKHLLVLWLCSSSLGSDSHFIILSCELALSSTVTKLPWRCGAPGLDTWGWPAGRYPETVPQKLGTTVSHCLWSCIPQHLTYSPF